MGIPTLLRYLYKRYPHIIAQCIEEKPKIVEGEKIPVDTSQKNPNAVEFDNLYLDMNGIIHPCCHPENKADPKDEEEMMVAIFEYIDRIFSIVRPRRLLYMAIDGVAPRAKLNQQRSKCFRSSKETVEKDDLISRMREELSGKGASLPPEKPKEEHFDSNCITPGTPFMARLAKCLHYYIHDRLNSDPGWSNIEVILSDTNVPGDAKYKIMDFIRRQHSNPEHDANTRHCLSGADGDLIMIGLATHEPHFSIIREDYKPNHLRPCELCGQLGHEVKECTGGAKQKSGKFDVIEKTLEGETQFLFVRLNVLREYLLIDMALENNVPFEFDLERIIDDWVFICFFVGNNFLPHIPSLKIREGAIDRIVEIYKEVINNTGGFVTESGNLDLRKVQLIFTNLGKVEDQIFTRRNERKVVFKTRQEKKMKSEEANKKDRPSYTLSGQFSPKPLSSKPLPVKNPRQEAYLSRVSNLSNSSRQQSESILKYDDYPSTSTSDGQGGVKRKCEDGSDSESEPEPEDDIKLWKDGWKDRYYELKFRVDPSDVEFRQKVAEAYVKGLCWILKYYYQGCASWNFYFPYHYAPFASDFINIGDLDIKWSKGTPLKPLEQLMAVLPAASKQHVPDSWGDLMCDPESPIIDFYPTDFKVDLKRETFAFQGVALLPFVDEKRLLKALKVVYPKLTEDEIKRNVRGKDSLYIRKGHKGYDFLTGLYKNGSNWKLEIDINPKLFSSMGGTVILSEDVINYKATVISPVQSLPDLPLNETVCVSFMDPQYPDGFIFPAERLKYAKDPPSVLKLGEIPVQDCRSLFGEKYKFANILMEPLHLDH